MNDRAWALGDWVAENATELRAGVHTLTSGSRVLDVGIKTPGGLAAGRTLAEICMGGLGHVTFVPLTIGGEMWSGVHVWTDHPAVSCMASQYAGWIINPDGFFAMGSGPIRAKARAGTRTLHQARVLQRMPSVACSFWKGELFRPTRLRRGWRRKPASPRARRRLSLRRRRAWREACKLWRA